MSLNTILSAFFHKFRLPEHLGFHKEAVENMKTYASSIPAAKGEWDAYETAVGQEGIMYSHTPGSPETKEIAALDKKRNQYWREILRRIKFSLNSPDEDIRKAADL